MNTTRAVNELVRLRAQREGIEAREKTLKGRLLVEADYRPETFEGTLGNATVMARKTSNLVKDRLRQAMLSRGLTTETVDQILREGTKTGESWQVRVAPLVSLATTERVA